MYSFRDKNQKIAVIGCGYWGTIIAKTLLILKFKNILIFDKNYKNSLTLKKKFSRLIIEKKYSKILKDDMFKDSSHFNKKGHKAVSIQISKEINNLINNY